MLGPLAYVGIFFNLVGLVVICLGIVIGVDTTTTLHSAVSDLTAGSFTFERTAEGADMAGVKAALVPASLGLVIMALGWLLIAQSDED